MANDNEDSLKHELETFLFILNQWESMKDNSTYNFNLSNYDYFVPYDIENNERNKKVVSSTITSTTLSAEMLTQDPCVISVPITYSDFTQIEWMKFGFVLIYIIIIIVSSIGNFMVIWTISRNKHMRTVTNYYILNLAVCDFIVALLVMPLKLLEYTAPCSWHIFHADTLCSVCTFFLPVFVFASVLTLVAISIERYYAIVYPLNAMTGHSKSRTRKILFAIWFIPCLVCLPYLFCESWAFNIVSNNGSVSRQICRDRFDDVDKVLGLSQGMFRKGYFLFLFCIMYLIPLLVILLTCIRIAKCLWKPISHRHGSLSCSISMTKRREESKRRVARMIITVAFTFIACWTPLYIINVITQLQKTSFLHKSNFLTTMLAAHLFGFINSAINPFIYHFMSERFRKSFTNILSTVFCCCTGLCPSRKDITYSWAEECDRKPYTARSRNHHYHETYRINYKAAQRFLLDHQHARYVHNEPHEQTRSTKTTENSTHISIHKNTAPGIKRIKSHNNKVKHIATCVHSVHNQGGFSNKPQGEIDMVDYCPFCEPFSVHSSLSTESNSVKSQQSTCRKFIREEFSSKSTLQASNTIQCETADTIEMIEMKQTVAASKAVMLKSPLAKETTDISQNEVRKSPDDEHIDNSITLLGQHKNYSLTRLECEYDTAKNDLNIEEKINNIHDKQCNHRGCSLSKDTSDLDSLLCNKRCNYGSLVRETTDCIKLNGIGNVNHNKPDKSKDSKLSPIPIAVSPSSNDKTLKSAFLLQQNWTLQLGVKRNTVKERPNSWQGPALYSSEKHDCPKSAISVCNVSI